MDTIDVRGLPDPLVQAIQRMVEILRDQLQENGKPAAMPAPRKVSLPVWPGGVIGSLRREDLYGDAL